MSIPIAQEWLKSEKEGDHGESWGWWCQACGVSVCILEWFEEHLVGI